MRFASITDRLAHLGSAKWAVHQEARRRRDTGENIIELTIGEPDVPAPQALIDKAVESLKARRIRYSSGRGEDSVVEAIARKYSQRTGRSITRANVAYLPGTQTALYVAMATLAETGDEVLVGDPLYATYEAVIRSTGAEVAYVPLDPARGFHMQPADLEDRITPRSRVLLLNSPHNPTGATLSRREIAAIVEICRRHKIWIVSDEVYESMVYGAAFASPFDLEEGADCTVALSSISKSHMLPGFRSGWCVGPEKLIERLLPVSESMLFGAQPFIQDAAAVAVLNSYPESRLMVENFHRRSLILAEMLANVPGLRCSPPEGGMFVMLDVSGTGLSGEAFAWRLLDEHKVAVMPGSSFGAQASGHVRISLTVEPNLLREAASRIRHLAIGLNGSAVVQASDASASSRLGI